MMKKILTFSVVLAMAFVMLSGPAAGYGETLQGITEDSFDGTRLNGGNVTVIHVQEPGDTAMYSETMTRRDAYKSDEFGWDGEGAYGWSTDPPSTVGDDLYFIKENSGYYAASYTQVTEDSAIKPDIFNMWDRMEPIAVPTESAVGEDYIELTIPAPKYTTWDSGSGNSANQGTFDCVSSYAVFMSDDSGATWSFAGNATNFVAGSAPLQPFADDETDPSTIDTGHYTFNTSTDGGLTLTAGTDYEFKIRVNIGPAEAEGGYGGGLGSYTTYGAGASSGPISTDPASEFGVGLIVPVVATIGLFATFTVYRKRKKDE